MEFITLILILLISAIDHVGSSSNPSRLPWSECPRKDFSYSLGSTFQNKLNHTLLDVLPENVLANGSWSFSGGQQGIDQIYAFCYCRGDVSPQDCRDCVKSAARTLLQDCRLLKEGIVWYEECTLRYANHSILSQEEEVPKYKYYNFSSVLSGLDNYQDVFDTLMNGLIRQADLGEKVKGFAKGETELLGSGLTLRGLVQCSPDIARPGPCQKCLRSAVKLMDGWPTTMIFLPSCIIRFDLYTSQTNPLLPEPQRSKRWLIKILVPVLAAFLLLLCLIVLLLILLIRNRRPPPNEQGGERAIRIYNYWHLALATCNFCNILILGRGGFGVVYKGRLLNGQQVAIKKLISHNDVDNGFQIEIDSIGRVISHPNVVTLLGYCTYFNERLLVYEYVPNKTLHYHLHGRGTRVLSWENRMTIAISLAGAFKFMHESIPAVIHRDIKPANILIDSTYQPKVGDFGIARLLQENRTHTNTSVKGTFSYLDPYYFTNVILRRESDVFAFGIVLLQLITGKKSILHLGEPDQITHLTDWAEPMIQSAMANQDDDNRFEDLIDTKLNHVYNRDQVECMVTCAAICVRPLPTERPSMNQVLQVLEGSEELIRQYKEALQIYWHNDAGEGR